MSVRKLAVYTCELCSHTYAVECTDDGSVLPKGWVYMGFLKDEEPVHVCIECVTSLK